MFIVTINVRIHMCTVYDTMMLDTIHILRKCCSIIPCIKLRMYISTMYGTIQILMVYNKNPTYFMY